MNDHVVRIAELSIASAASADKHRTGIECVTLCLVKRDAMVA
jgi:hypothetical protein